MIKTLEKIGIEIVGSLLYAAGIGYFLGGVNVAPGGISGVALMINYLSGFPIGTATLILNLPIIAWGWYILGRDMMLRTMRIILISSVMLDLSSAFSSFSGDRLLGAIFGGLLTGAGIGIIFSSGATTGGVDVLGYIAKRRFPHLKIGLLILIIDSIIITASVAVYRDIEAGLYGIICLYCTTKIIDTIIYGGEGGSTVFIISKHSSQIADYIMKNMDRGVTLINCSGGYSKKEFTMLLCAVRKRELARLRIAIKEQDELAFMMCMRSSNIFGEGFEG